ncbi:hypothetical protein TNCV_1735971 [Trichonephila clavipes]|nr:hypothetical protein TNCV_1735971 [Trichonephila clavipes]
MKLVMRLKKLSIFAKQINLEADSYVVQELLSALNKKLTMDELIQIHETLQDTEELESLNLVQLEDRMMVGNWTADLSLIEKVYKFLKIHIRTKSVFFQQNME